MDHERFAFITSVQKKPAILCKSILNRRKKDNSGIPRRTVFKILSVMCDPNTESLTLHRWLRMCEINRSVYLPEFFSGIDFSLSI